MSSGDTGHDIDFLVEFEAGRSLLDQVHLIDELGSLLGTPVEVVAKGDLRLITERLIEKSSAKPPGQ